MKMLPALLMYLWAGMVLGISFLEAPLKFKAPGITTTLGVGIGKLVFNVLNKIELLLFISILLLLGIKQILKAPSLYFIGILMFCLVLQSAYLLPVMNSRIDKIIQGGIPNPGSFYHISYIVLEIIKCATLLWGGYFLLKSFFK